MENGHLRVCKGKRIPKSTYCQLANTVGRESRAEVDVRSGPVNLDHGRIGTRMPEESLSDKQRTRNVGMDGVHVIIAVHMFNRF